jgi:peptide chain release factor subunit 1
MSQVDYIELWKIKKTVKMLSEAKGNGTSMISLVIPPDKSLSVVNNMLTTEYGTATNIKSRVNRLSVLSAITSTQQKLKQYKTVPSNGIALYCGEMMIENKEKKVTFAIEPFKPLTKFLYLCDSKFHTEALEDLLLSEEKYGFIIMDGHGALYGLLQGNSQSVLHKFTVSLPKKHRAGGQSALRFSRLRDEARHNYVRKVGELATNYFISNDLPNVKGLILAGSADFKSELDKSAHLDPRLKEVVLQVIDISYGGQSGFNQAIQLSASLLANVKLIEEKKLLEKFFEEINIDTGKYCFGIQQTMDALDQGAVETLIVWEDSMLYRYVFTNSKNEEVIRYFKEHEKIDAIDPDTNNIMNLKSKDLWTEWIAENFQAYGTNLEFVTDKSSIGTQFVTGFGGIGGILRWAVKFDYDEIIELEEQQNQDSDKDINVDEDLDDFFF